MISVRPSEACFKSANLATRLQTQSYLIIHLHIWCTRCHLLRTHL